MSKVRDRDQHRSGNVMTKILHRQIHAVLPVAAGGQGIHLFDAEGRSYIDLEAGPGVASPAPVPGVASPAPGVASPAPGVASPAPGGAAGAPPSPVSGPLATSGAASGATSGATSGGVGSPVLDPAGGGGAGVASMPVTISGGPACG